ncbi:hypothetical protein Plhal304r1_c033g0105571 [Plasmopara halstedii]
MCALYDLVAYLGYKLRRIYEFCMERKYFAIKLYRLKIGRIFRESTFGSAPKWLFMYIFYSFIFVLLCVAGYCPIICRDTLGFICM